MAAVSESSAQQASPAAQASHVDPTTGQFVDPLFATVFAGALAETLVVWVKDRRMPDGFAIGVVSVGYTNLLLSWFGYHKSVLKRPIKGGLRFMITVALLPAYLLTIMIFSEASFRYNAAVYGATFFLWTVWEYLKSIEHGLGRTFRGLLIRPYNIMVFFAAGFAFGARYGAKDLWFINYANELSLGMIALAIVVLRVSKAMTDPTHPYSQIRSAVRTLLLGGARVASRENVVVVPDPQR